MDGRINGSDETVTCDGRWNFSGITGDKRELYSVEKELFFGHGELKGYDRFIALEKVPKNIIDKLHGYGVLKDYN